MPADKMDRPNNQLKIGGFVIMIVLVMVYGFVIQENDSRLVLASRIVLAVRLFRVGPPDSEIYKNWSVLARAGTISGPEIHVFES